MVMPRATEHERAPRRTGLTTDQNHPQLKPRRMWETHTHIDICEPNEDSHGTAPSKKVTSCRRESPQTHVRPFQDQEPQKRERGQRPKVPWSRSGSDKALALNSLGRRTKKTQKASLGGAHPCLARSQGDGTSCQGNHAAGRVSGAARGHVLREPRGTGCCLRAPSRPSRHPAAHSRGPLSCAADNALQRSKRRAQPKACEIAFHRPLCRQSMGKRSSWRGNLNLRPHLASGCDLCPASQ